MNPMSLKNKTQTSYFKFKMLGVPTTSVMAFPAANHFAKIFLKATKMLEKQGQKAFCATMTINEVKVMSRPGPQQIVVTLPLR